MRMVLKKIVISSCLLSTLFTMGCGSVSSEVTKETATKSMRKGEKVSAAVVQEQYATFTTNVGEFTVRLYGDKTPVTVKNFVDLVKKGFYDQVIFHRVIDGFMIQGGDPLGNGTGGPGYTIPDEFDKDLHFDKAGLLAMANRGPNTGGSQFFITLAPTPWLDNKHTIFGEVVKGLDVVEKIGKVKTDSKNDRPLTPIVIESITFANPTKN